MAGDAAGRAGGLRGPGGHLCRWRAAGVGAGGCSPPPGESDNSPALQPSAGTRPFITSPRCI